MQHRCITEITRTWHHQQWDMKLHIHFNTTEEIFWGGWGFFIIIQIIQMHWVDGHLNFDGLNPQGQSKKTQELIEEGSPNHKEGLSPAAFVNLSFCQTCDFAGNGHPLACTTCCKVLVWCFFPRLQQLPHPIACLIFLKQTHSFPRSLVCPFHSPSVGHGACGTSARTLCPT